MQRLRHTLLSVLVFLSLPGAATAKQGGTAKQGVTAEQGVAAQQGVAAPPPTTQVPGLPVPIFGPPPPAAPATAARDAAGRLTIRAERLTSPLRIDGKLDEAIYSSVPPVSDFVQLEPRHGEPATQKTEFWILFDNANVYIGLRAHESNLEGMIANEMRRDNQTLTQNEYVNFVFDTFYDRRNAQIFLITPSGGRMDGQLTNERQFNSDWNPVWNVKVGRFEGGWTAEAAIPFKALRYQPGRTQVWGLHVARSNRWKNEISLPIPMSQARGQAVSFQISEAPTLVGIEAPPGARNLEIKPYVISSVASDRTITPQVSNDVSNDVSGDFGGDVKYGITQSLSADFTYNTDFAQVEADEQSKRMNSRSTSRASACSSQRSTTSFSRIRGRSRLAASRQPAPGTPRCCSTAAASASTARASSRSTAAAG